MIPTYRFYINYNSVVTEVHPLNWLDCYLVDEKEKDQIFYRRKFNGDLTFGGKKLHDDFLAFWNIEQSDPFGRIDFLILEDLNIYWEGYFTAANGSFDLDAGTFKVAPFTTDDYVDFVEGGDNEYNILNVTAMTVNFNDGVLTEEYTRCRLLNEVIEYLAEKINPSLSWAAGTLQSDFLTAAINPITSIDNKYSHLTIAQKSDIKRPNSSNPATVGMMSFNEMMNILRCMNLYWEYDGTNLIIEHISHWTSAAGIDLRNQDLMTATNKYRYVNEKIPKYEVFKWMEANTTDFVGASIWYDSPAVNQDSDSNTQSYEINVTTDLEYIRQCCDGTNDSLISDDGWVLLANELDGTDYNVYFGTGPMGGTHFNIYLAWSKLHDSFFRHERQLPTGYLNGNLVTFYSAKKIRQQECSIIYCSDFDPGQYLTTELGETYLDGAKGYVDKAVIKPYGEINLTLLYGPAPVEPEPEEEDKTMIITEVKTNNTPQTTYYITMNRVETVDLTVSIWLTCMDASYNTCETVPVSTVIPAGSLTGTIVVDWCYPSGPPECIAIRHKTIDPMLGWTGSFINDPNANCV